MAIVDYGCIVLKNGVNIQKERFMNMEKTLGFSIDEVEDHSMWWYNKKIGTIRIKDYFFGYAGNKECFLCFYKMAFCVVENDVITRHYDIENYFIPFNKGDYSSRFSSDYITTETNRLIKIKSINGVSRFVVEFIDSDKNKWKIFYGFGIDFILKEFKKYHTSYGFKNKEYRQILRECFNKI